VYNVPVLHGPGGRVKFGFPESGLTVFFMGLFNGHQAKNIDSLVFNPVKCGVTVADM
jgi:hypothetical protein